MLSFFLVGILAASAMTLLSYLFLQKKVLDELLSLDDAKGYLLIISVLIAFSVSLIGFYVGQLAGYDQSEETSTQMALAILLDVTAALMCLIFGLQRMREPEHY